jgi:hypothetical protein
MVIPREGEKVRLYIQLAEVPATKPQDKKLWSKEAPSSSWMYVSVLSHNRSNIYFGECSGCQKMLFTVLDRISSSRRLVELLHQ